MKKENILIVVAHTDDETIGCGGTIVKLVKQGYNVFAMSFTDGVSSREKNLTKKIKERMVSAKKASKILGFKWIKNLNYPDNEMDSVSLLNVTNEIEKIKNQIKPSIVITHNFSDLNIDHRKVAEATLTAFRPQPNEKLKKFLTFETPSSTDYRYMKNLKNFVPNYFINIKYSFKKKILALKAYKKEIKKKPHSRSIDGIKNLAKLRGNQVGLEFVEAFDLIRFIDNEK